jgi:DNA polymerase III alpha subunit
MRPRALVNQAKAKGLDMIAICDHNSAENTAAFIRAGDERDLKVLPGLKSLQGRKSISLPSSIPRRAVQPSKI